LGNALKQSRFLRYLALGFVFMSVDELANAGCDAVRALVSQAPEVLPSIQVSCSLLDSTLSIVASLCFLGAWRLLQRYPEPALTQMEVIVAIVGCILQIFIAMVSSASAPVITSTIDIFLAAASAIMVGLGLRRLPDRMELGPAVRIMKKLAMSAFVVWGIFQLPYLVTLERLPNVGRFLTPIVPDWLMKQVTSPSSEYFMLLLLLGVVSAGLAAIVSIMCLEPRRQGADAALAA
jgi:hypothetical protein